METLWLRWTNMLKASSNFIMKSNRPTSVVSLKSLQLIAFNNLYIFEETQ